MDALRRLAIMLLIALAVAIVFNGIFWVFYTYLSGIF